MPSPGTVAIGGALVLLGEAKSLAEEGDVTYSFDSASKDADPRNADACSEACKFKEAVSLLPEIRTTALIGIDTLRIRLKVVWEYNGCDIKGATFAFTGNTTARLGRSAQIEATVVESGMTEPTACPECCEECACVKFHVHVTRKTPLQGAYVYSWQVRVCGSGHPAHIVML